MLSLRNIPERFLQMLKRSKSDEEFKEYSFARFHETYVEQTNNSKLRRFLTATMDEVRLYYAEQYAEDLLRINYSAVWKYFRRAVLLREITGKMEFERQRDHSAHTLHNYLLGWFVFSQSPVIRQAADKQFQRIHNGDQGINWQFGQMWPIVSLLHDIGYLFEGSLHVRDVSHRNANLVQGAEYASEYFRHDFWNSNRVRTQQEIDRAIELTGISIPQFRAGSISEVARSLRSIPAINGIKLKLLEKQREKAFAVNPEVDFCHFQPDCYRLWSAYYVSYGQIEMSRRIDALEKAEHILMSKGIPGKGFRIVDHGLAGAMLLLQAATTWYEICCALPEKPPTDKAGRHVWNCFRKDPSDNHIDIEPQWYWSGILWATAAVAMHNLAQTNWASEKNSAALKISVDMDVMSYLGILVDILEEWDRYTMRRDSIYAGEAHLPIQARDVRIGVSKAGRIIVEYPTKKAAEKVQKGLEESLADWKNIVELRTTRERKTP